MSSVVDQSTFLSIDLKDLTNPHQMCTYFQSLPLYKSCCSTASDDNDEITDDSMHLKIAIDPNQDRDSEICGAIAQFVYTQQIDGRFFLDKFTDSDFEQMLSLSTTKSIDLSSAEWIWKMLSYSINLSLKKTTSKSLDDMEWINSSWTKYQFISMTKNECPPLLSLHRRSSSALLSPLQSETNLVLDVNHVIHEEKPEDIDQPIGCTLSPSPRAHINATQ